MFECGATGISSGRGRPSGARKPLNMMNHFLLRVLSLCFFVVGSAGLRGAIDAVVAFPGAEGFGAVAIGGRGGDVYVVSSLSDAGPGSLREWIRSAQGPRTIVFS